MFADSDICVNPNYLNTLTEPLCKSSVSVITCSYLDYTPKVFRAALGSLGRSIDFISSVLAIVICDLRSVQLLPPVNLC
ncbi:glycosyltransferase [Nostoc sp. PA-18-2419]|uniref:glycosyltransferase n=1 Tax=Nostoc sp. PA-18-2419 TaxID=2575443 RepID=UPI0011088349